MSGIYGRIIIMSNTLEKFIHFCEFAPFLSLSSTCENLNEIISPRFYLPSNFLNQIYVETGSNSPSLRLEIHLA